MGGRCVNMLMFEPVQPFQTSACSKIGGQSLNGYCRQIGMIIRSPQDALALVGSHIQLPQSLVQAQPFAPVLMWGMHDIKKGMSCFFKCKYLMHGITISKGCC